MVLSEEEAMRQAPVVGKQSKFLKIWEKVKEL
jgi:hypothetical protein